MSSLSKSVAELANSNANLTQQCSELTDDINQLLLNVDNKVDTAFSKVRGEIKNTFEQVLYVNADQALGSDSNDGLSLQTPLKTIKAAVAKLVPGCFARIMLAANDVEHVCATVTVPDCSVIFSAYTEDDWQAIGLKMRFSGSIAFNTRGDNASISLELFGEFQKTILMAGNRLFENLGKAAFSLASDSASFPVVVFHRNTTGQFFPYFVAANYAKFSKIGLLTMSNVTFASHISNIAGETVYEPMPHIRLDTPPVGGAVLAVFNNVDMHCEQLSNPGVELATGCYLISKVTGLNHIAPPVAASS
ncbi:hypothetical protein [Pseudoalteromonas luteoviolacea]|uniref:Uncharacterized protein n=1 Tax=Pseudoalteromonas luteoviolacea H33 TaxID=1365251 RepID=A0A167FWP8_9GAMM|nr:hypothetical protein [Pseudoalteromonas luteoviolacea]KZN53311.1 hypothetical protein N476_08545 [Pseudoalteromonas luteoviolacea H33]KZN76766.1 hypothetical protein N477_15095 [Pseudoalteromonas luteoviolacea H33-S]MBQ4878921.1 hypothetical protein [Pseudoalteromonas luteoviolacea]MBQ4907902.1 hypothetical protein [Pseudoalteromonas luteoviolacea]